MALPILTTVSDITAVCNYLATKSVGATLTEAKSVLDKKHLDGRKLNALKVWGLIDHDGDRIRLTELGRLAVKDNGAQQSKVLVEVVRKIPPYNAVIEKAFHRQEKTTTATEIGAHWHDNFNSECSSNENTLNGQVLCFCHIAEGGGLGKLTVGRKGKQTRFDFNLEAIGTIITPTTIEEVVANPLETGDKNQKQIETSTTEERNNKIFIAHGKNRKILEQVKKLLKYGKFNPIVSIEHETTAQPLPQKIMDDMGSCIGAVIHISPEQYLEGENGKEVQRINDNVLIEIGAAMALYKGKFILLVQEGVALPSNLQGLHRCDYQGDMLDMEAAMKLLEALGSF